MEENLCYSNSRHSYISISVNNAVHMTDCERIKHAEVILDIFVICDVILNVCKFYNICSINSGPECYVEILVSNLIIDRRVFIRYFNILLYKIIILYYI